MIEIKRIIPGLLVDQGHLNEAEEILRQCVQEITNARGLRGEYRIRVQWFSDYELADEQRKAAGK